MDLSPVPPRRGRSPATRQPVPTGNAGVGGSRRTGSSRWTGRSGVDSAAVRSGAASPCWVWWCWVEGVACGPPGSGSAIAWPDGWVGSAWTTPEAVLTGSRPPASGAEQALRPAAGAAIREVAARRRSRAPTERLREESTGIPLPRPQPCVPGAGRTWPPETGARSGAGYRRTVTATISLQPVPARRSGPWGAVIRLREASLRRQRPRAFRDVLLGLGQGASRLGPAAAPLRHAGTRARTLPAWRTLDPPPPTGRRRWARWWAGCGRTGPRLRALRAEAAGDSDGWPGSWRGRGSAFPAPDRRASRGARSKIGPFRLWHQTL